MQQERLKKKLQAEQQQNFNLLNFTWLEQNQNIWCKTCAFNIIALYKPGFYLH